MVGRSTSTPRAASFLSAAPFPSAVVCSILAAACACPPAPPVAPAPAEKAAEPRPHDEHAHRHGAKEGHHGAHDGPLVHRFTEGGDYWRARFEEPGRDASQRPEEVIAAMAIEPGTTVADIGAGTGYFMKRLAEAVGAGGRVLALDIEPAMVRYLKQRAKKEGLANVEPRLGLTDDPLLPEASVARVLIVNTWHHVPEREAYAKKLFAALEPGGEVFIVDFDMKTTRGPDKAHRLEPTKVVAELEAAGLETRVDEDLLPDQYIVVGKRPPALP